MTTGNHDPAPASPSAEALVAHTVDLIVEKGGSLDVNMREVARRAGFAHTNVYNYYPSFDDLLWEAFRRVLGIYGTHLDDGLAPGAPASSYLGRFIENIVSFPIENPGLYRFIGSDPLGPDIPTDILETVSEMKQWMLAAFRACAPQVEPAVADEAGNIVYAYIDGETFNLINARVVPGEDVAGRVTANAARLYDLLTGNPVSDDPVVHPIPPWRRDAA